MATLAAQMLFYGLRFWVPRLLVRGARSIATNAARRITTGQATLQANRIAQINARTRVNNLRMQRSFRSRNVRKMTNKEAYTPLGKNLKRAYDTVKDPVQLAYARKKYKVPDSVKQKGMKVMKKKKKIAATKWTKRKKYVRYKRKRYRIK